MLCIHPELADQATVFMYADRGVVLSCLGLCCVGFALHSSSIARLGLCAHEAIWWSGLFLDVPDYVCGACGTFTAGSFDLCECKSISDGGSSPPLVLCLLALVCLQHALRPWPGLL